MLTTNWVDNQEYVEQVERLIEPLRTSRFYDPMRFGFLDTTRFDYFIDVIRTYTSLEGKTILDSGCGSGGLCIRLLRHNPQHVTGIELDAEHSRLAALRMRDLESVSIINNDASLALLPAESFDIIFSLHVIEHVVDAPRYLKEMATLLKPGGLMFLACPHRLWPFEAHTGLPLINYLPRGFAKQLAQWLARTPGISADLKRSLETSVLYEHDFSHFALKREILAAGLEILEQDHPRFFEGDLLGRRQYALYRLVTQLALRWRWYLSALFSRNINAVCRKPVH